jgi:hypothetical protein
MSAVIHIRGFGPPPERPDELATGVSAAVIEGGLPEIAQATLDACRNIGHDVKVSTLRDLDGWLREVHAIVTIPGHEERPMWHRFVSPGEEWKR